MWKKSDSVKLMMLSISFPPGYGKKNNAQIQIVNSAPIDLKNIPNRALFVTQRNHENKITLVRWRYTRNRSYP